MINMAQLFIIILAGVSVGIADALIKKASIGGSFSVALKSPLMLAVLALYIVQILLFVYVFKHQWNLSIVGNLQIVFFSITTILAGLLFFGENISLIQGAGICLALVGVIFMNL